MFKEFLSINAWWSSIFLQLAYDWEVLELEEDEADRAEYKPTHDELDFVTGEIKKVRGLGDAS